MHVEDDAFEGAEDLFVLCFVRYDCTVDTPGEYAGTGTGTCNKRPPPRSPGGDTVRLPHKNDDHVDNEPLGDFTRALSEHAYCTCESYSSKHTFSTRCFLLSWRLQERMCKARGKLAVSQGGDVQRMVEDILTMAMSHYWVKLQTPKMRLLSSGVGEGSSHRER
jgi:hypothetical protein